MTARAASAAALLRRAAADIASGKHGPVLISPAHLGAHAPGANAPPPVAAPSLAIQPHDPPSFSSLPATWTPTVAVTSLAAAKWAVFQVSPEGAYSSDMLWQEVARPAGSPVSWSFSPSAQIKFERDRLVVKSLDDAVEDTSGPAVLNAPPPAATDGLSAARAFVSDLGVGVNIERGQAIWNGWITTAQLRQYVSQGCTHFRFFPPVGGRTNNWPNVSAGELDWYFEACERGMAEAKCLVSIFDIMDEGHMADGRVMPFVDAFADRVKARGWNAARYALGVANEYEAGSNAGHRGKRLEALGRLRTKLPDALLMSAAANWNNVWTMLDDSYDPGTDPRMLHEWHLYHNEAWKIEVTQDIQNNVGAWMSRRNLVAICGEWGIGPPDNSNGAAENYSAFPSHIDAAARGMGQQRPTMWTVTAGSWWRLNESGSGALRSEVATAITNGTNHIKSQSWFQPITGTGGGGNPAPTGNQVARIQLLLRGQSNQQYAAQYGADGALRDTMAALCQIPVDLISRVNVSDDNTIHSGTYTYWDSPYNGDPRWLNPGSNYGSAPSGWTNEYPMSQTLNAVSRFVSTDRAIPLIDVPVHWEYDLAMEDAASKAAYRNGAWEVPRRIRAARLKDDGKHLRAIAYCPYQGGNWHALDDIDAAWVADIADATRSTVMACGNMLDGEPNTQWIAEGDYSHWGDQSAPRIYPRIGFRLARLAYDRGWLPSGVDLSDCPSMGPRITGATRSGNSITVTVAHDRGSGLVAGQDGIDWAAFTASDGSGQNHFDATGGAILSATQIRVDFPSTPATGGRVWHCKFPAFRRKRLIRDNWHSIRPAKYASVANVGVVEFPLQRTAQGIAY